jgi:hypothetical protein
MSINSYLTHILNGNLEIVKTFDNALVNKIGRINPKGYNVIPLFAALGLYLENQEKGMEMLNYLLDIPDINVSKIVIHDNGSGWVKETRTIFHLISMEKISKDICKMILDHPSFDINALNTIDHDDYRSLDLADEYNPNIVKLLESKGAIRHLRVGPGFKPKE